MSRKGPIIFISGWLTAFTLGLVLCQLWSVTISPSSQAALFFLAVAPVILSARLFRSASASRSVTQILYDQEHEAVVPVRTEVK